MYVEKTDYDDIEMSSRLRNVLRRNGFEFIKNTCRVSQPTECSDHLILWAEEK